MNEYGYDRVLKSPEKVKAINENILVNGSVRREIHSRNSNIDVEGSVRGKIDTDNDKIDIKGDVGGNIEAIGDSDITVAGLVKGDVVENKGAVVNIEG